MPKSTFEKYLNSISDALKGQEAAIQAALHEVVQTQMIGARMWVLGNGGSLAIAQHFAQDMLKVHGIKAQCMNDGSVITAFTNDHGFEWSMYDPLKVLIDPDDLIFAFSCSGKSRNYEQVFDKFKNRKVAVVGTDGGFMKQKATVCVHAKSNDYIVCEAAFGVVSDLINKRLGE